LQQAGVTVKPAMELDHTETIKRAVMAGLGVAFVSRYAIEDEVRSGRLRVLPVQRLKIRRHFHVIHDERRPLSASARAFITFLEGKAQSAPPLRSSSGPR
jgi:DNA-binding transcriptional LysR family regulator